MGELLPIRRNRGFAVPQRQEVSRAEKQPDGSQKVSRGTGLAVSDTLRQTLDRTGRAEGLESRRTVQTGESVLAEVQEKLGSMAELIRAAGEDGADLEALQAELEKLCEEIDRMTGSAAAAGGMRLFLDGDAGAVRAFPAWLAAALVRDDMTPEILLAGLGLDGSAGGAELLAALAGRSPEEDPVAGYLAALYLGAVIAGGSRSGELDLSKALGGLAQLLERVAEGVPLDEAVEQLTGGEYASLADFREQFMDGMVPGLRDFLVQLLLSGGGEVPEDPLLSLLAGAGGLEPDLLLALMAPGETPAPEVEAGADLADLAEGMPSAAGASEAAAPAEAARPMSVVQFGALQVMGRDLSAVSYDAAGARLTIGGTADVAVYMTVDAAADAAAVQGTAGAAVQGAAQGAQGTQEVLVTGSGTVTLRDVRAVSLAVDAAEARIVTVGRSVLGEVRLGEGTALTLDGRGMLRAGAFRGGEGAVLRLVGGAVAVQEGDGGTLGTVAIPVLLDGTASLAAQAASVRSLEGEPLEPLDVVWRALFPGFSAVNSLAVDGRQARMALMDGGGHADAARLWLAKGDLSAHGYPARTLMIRGRDEAGRSRTRYAYLCWDRRAGAFREASQYPNPFTVTGGEPDRDWVYEEESHTLRILTGQVTAVSGGAGTDARQAPFSGRIALTDGIGAVKLTLDGVVCRVASGRAFHLGRDNDVTLVLGGGTNNHFESGAGCAGISLGAGTSLRIDCAGPESGGGPAGVLTATGGTGGAGIGPDEGAGRSRSGHIMIRGGVVTGGEKPGQAGTVTIVGGGGSPEPGSAKPWARMGLFLQMGEDAVVLPQFPLSSRTLQLNKLRISTREYARAARMTIDADRRWVSRLQTAYSTVSNRLEQRASGPVRDDAAATLLLREMARSAPILSDRAMQARSLKSLEEVNRLLR